MRAFQEAVERGEFETIGNLLAEDIVFRSPVAFKPYHGRAMVAAILRGVNRAFTEFRYSDVIGAPDARTQALVFETMVGDVSLNGCDFITTNEDGLISEFTVMVRPLSASQALAAAMAAQFDQIAAEATAELTGK